MMKNILSIFAVLMLSSCAHSVHQYHVGGHAPYKALKKGKVITAQAERESILGLAYDTLYLDQAYDSLLSQCEKGKITGVATQLSTSLGFFSWTDKVRMEALCI